MGLALPHTLYTSPPGLGKTTFALATANELGSTIEVANGGNLRAIKNLLPYLMRIKERSILFIDEIHRMTIQVQEYLYPVMEDYRVDLGKEQKTSIDIPQFTLIGATTHTGLLTKPFRDRFVQNYLLEEYSLDDLSNIARLTSNKFGFSLSDESAQEIAKRSKFTPRIVNNLIIWLRDWMISNNINNPNPNHICTAMQFLKIDEIGLTEQDAEYLMIVRQSKKPVGITTLCSLLNLPRETIEHTIEPFLLRQKLIAKTDKGRIAL